MRCRFVPSLLASLSLILLSTLIMGQGCVVTDVDSDGDGYPDQTEINNNPPTDPYDPIDNPAHVHDSDGDGCSDYGEIAFGQCDGNPHTPPPPGVSVSGRILVGSSLIVDSDTNDPSNPFLSNDSISPSGSQTVSTPCTIGGFLGDTSHKVDELDVYRAQMAAGQVATLLLADPGTNDFDLYLYDESGDNELDSSEGIGRAEQVTAPSDGTFLIEVRGYSVIRDNDPGGLYSLLIGEDLTTSLGAAAGKDRLSSLYPFVEDEVLVQYDENFKSAQANTQKSLGFEELNDGQTSGGFHRLRLTGEGTAAFKAAALARAAGSATVAPISPTIAAIKALRRQSGVRSAQPNYIRRAFAVPNDEFYHSQWHYPFINLPAAWDITTGSPNVIVAVVDTGVALGHPDLAGQLIAGYDFIADARTAMDGNGIDSNPDDPGDSSGFGIPSSFHGTHVAGTIAARTNNGTGVAGVAWNVRLMPLRVLGRGGEGTDYDIAQAVRYAAKLSNDSGTLPTRRADIINMSLGGPGSSSVLENAVNAARQAGVTIVTAAGNEAANADNSFPGAIDGVINVSAVDQSRNLAPYSNRGSSVAVCAPGGNLHMDYDGDGLADGILSTLKDDDGSYTYAFYDGTSMAAPHVAGVVALMKSVDPNLTPLEFDRLLAGTHPGTSISIVDDLGTAGRDTLYGYGLINALHAVRAAGEISGASPTETPILRVVPQDLSLGSSLTSAPVTVSNGGGATLAVTSASANKSWLSVSPASGGVGDYTITVDRDGLSAGVYSGTVAFTSNGGSDSVTVRMSVGQAGGTGGDVGTLYVLLVDPNTLDTIAQATTDASANYQFTFEDVPQGEYRLYAGTDMNDDFFIDDQGEAFGGYPVSSQPQVVSLTGNLSGLSFSATYLVNIQNPTGAGQLPGGSVAPTPRLRRLGAP
jgi:serine protease